MKTSKKLFPRIIIFALLIVVFLGVTGLVFADSPDPSAAGVNQLEVIQSPPGSTADEPEGLVAQQQAAPGGVDPATGEVFGPVENSPVGSLADEQTSAAPSGPAPSLPMVNSFLSVAGTALQPVNSSSAYSYNIFGCITAPTGSFQAPIQLPEGSVIKYLRFYYQNLVPGSNVNGTTWIYTYNPTGSGANVVSVSGRSAATIGSAGYNSDLSILADHTVGNVTHAYVFIWNPAGTDQALCGFRINYDRPFLTGSYIPLVEK